MANGVKKRDPTDVAPTVRYEILNTRCTDSRLQANLVLGEYQQVQKKCKDCTTCTRWSMEQAPLLLNGSDNDRLRLHIGTVQAILWNATLGQVDSSPKAEEAL